MTIQMERVIPTYAAGAVVMARGSAKSAAPEQSFTRGMLSRRTSHFSYRSSVLLNLLVAALFYGLVFLAIVSVVRLVDWVASHL